MLIIVNYYLFQFGSTTAPFAGQMQNNNNVGAFGASLQPAQLAPVSKQTSYGF
jgi:hypothetical protein